MLSFVASQGHAAGTRGGRTSPRLLGSVEEVLRFKNAVIRKCYVFWMIGVLIDHYMRCYSSSAPFCAILAQDVVKPWSVILVHSFGNDQDMFGFIMLGAYQDARPAREGAKPKVDFGMKICSSSWST